MVTAPGLVPSVDELVRSINGAADGADGADVTKSPPATGAVDEFVVRPGNEFVGAIVGTTPGEDVADGPAVTGVGVKTSSGEQVGKSEWSEAY